MVKLLVTAVTTQVRVNNFEKGRRFYVRLLGREPDLEPHEDFAEWEIVDRCWLQVSLGEPVKNSGPLRFGVEDIYAVENIK